MVKVRANLDFNLSIQGLCKVNDCVFIVPVDLMQGLRGASDEDLMDFSLMPRGFDLHWHRLDAQFTVFGLMQGRCGRSRAAATTKNKRRSAASN